MSSKDKFDTDSIGDTKRGPIVDTTTDVEDSIDGQDDVRVPQRRQIGLFSAVFIIFNRIIGTGCVGIRLKLVSVLN